MKNKPNNTHMTLVVKRDNMSLLPRKIRCPRSQKLQQAAWFLFGFEDVYIDLDTIADTLMSRNQVFANMATTMIKSGNHNFLQ